MQKITLLLIDIQNDYFTNGKMVLEGSEEASLNARLLLERFRLSGLPVVHVQHIAEKPGATFFTPGSEGSEIHRNVKPTRDEKVIIKHYPNSFRETDLLSHLKDLGTTDLVICGMMTHMCIDATTRAAKDLGFNCILVGDACATKMLEINGQKVKSEEVHNSFLAALSYYYSTVITTQSLLQSIAIEGYVEVTGGRVWYRIVGADKKGIPLLLVHGGPGAPHDYLEPLEALAVERPVIFYDQLGCGNSDRPSDHTLWNTARYVDELTQLRKALKLDKIHLLGQSWGAMLAVEYLLREKPKGVVSLTLSGPLLSSARWISDQKMWVSLLPDNLQKTISSCESAQDYSSEDYQDAMNAFYKKHLCRMDPWPECLNHTNSKMGVDVYMYMWGPSEFCATGILKDAELSCELHKIGCPVLLTCGEFDEATPATTAYYQSLIKDSRLFIFDGCSHSHHLEKTEEYIKVVGDFIFTLD